MYPYVYSDGNCAIYSTLLAVKKLSYDVIKFEKPKRNRAHIAFITRKYLSKKIKEIYLETMK